MECSGLPGPLSVISCLLLLDFISPLLEAYSSLIPKSLKSLSAAITGSYVEDSTCSGTLYKFSVSWVSSPISDTEFGMFPFGFCVNGLEVREAISTSLDDLLDCVEEFDLVDVLRMCLDGLVSCDSSDCAIDLLSAESL